MPNNKSKDQNRRAAQAHVNHTHECSLCGKRVKGNGYYAHRNACRRKHGVILPYGSLMCMFGVFPLTKEQSEAMEQTELVRYEGILGKGDVRSYREKYNATNDALRAALKEVGIVTE